MLVVGLTFCVPPFAAKLYELPSLPVTVTVVALDAVTVNVDELPAATDVGLAVIATVAAEVAWPDTLVPHPEKNRENDRHNIAAAGSRRWEKNLGALMCDKFNFLPISEWRTKPDGSSFGCQLDLTEFSPRGPLAAQTPRAHRYLCRKSRVEKRTSGEATPNEAIPIREL